MDNCEKILLPKEYGIALKTGIVTVCLRSPTSNEALPSVPTKHGKQMYSDSCHNIQRREGRNLYTRRLLRAQSYDICCRRHYLLLFDGRGQGTEDGNGEKGRVDGADDGGEGRGGGHGEGGDGNNPAGRSANGASREAGTV